MKNILKLIFILMIFMISCKDDTVKYNDYELMLTDNGYEIIKYNGDSDNITLPFTYDNKLVNKVCANAFNKTMTVTLTDKVYIENNAFPDVTFYINNLLDILDEIKQENYTLKKIVNVITEINENKTVEEYYNEGEKITLNNNYENFSHYLINNKKYYKGDILEINKDDIYIKCIYNEFVDVSFNTNFDDLKLDNIQYNINDTIILPTLSKEGYTFKGWEEDEKIVTTVSKNTTLNAVWEKNTYILTIKYNGIISDTYTEYKYLDEVTLQNVLIEGYEFIGFYYNDEKVDKITIKENISVLAKYNKTKAKVIIDYNYDNKLTETIYTNLNETINLDIPKRDGYQFMGFSETNYEVYVDKYTHNNGKVLITDDVYLYAIWLPNQYAHLCIEDTFENNPWHYVYHVTTYEEFITIRNHGYVFFENDINCRKKEIPDFFRTDRNDEEGLYKGYIDGNGYCLKNFVINANKNYNGLFRILEGYIYNLTIENVEINMGNSANYTGVLFGKQNKGVVSNVHIKNVKYNATTGTNGVVGGYSLGKLENISASAQVTFDNFNGIFGGITGYKGIYSEKQIDSSNVDKVKVDVTYSGSGNNINGAFGEIEKCKISNVSVRINSDLLNINGFAFKANECIVTNSYVNTLVNLLYGFIQKIEKSKISYVYSFHNGIKLMYEESDSVIENSFSNIHRDKVTYIMTFDKDVIFNQLGFSDDWILNDILMLKWEVNNE